MRIDYNGNVGIGASSTDALESRTAQGYRSLRLNNFNINAGEGAYGFIGQNIYQDSAGVYKFIDTNDSSSIHFWGNAMQFHMANGSADATQSGSEKMRITTAGRVGIGTASPTAPLHVYTGGNNPGSIFESDATSGSWIRFKSNQSGAELFKAGTNAIGWHVYNDTDADYRLTVTNDGNVGIGDNAPSQKLNVAGNIMLEGSDQYMYLSNVGTFNSGIYVRGISGSTTLRSHSTGIFTWEVLGSEKMRLNSNGHFLLNAPGHNFNTTQPIQEIYTPGATNGGLSIKSNESSAQAYHALGLWVGANGSTSTGYAASFYHGNGGNNRGTITVTSSGVTYNTTSDYRLKENIEIIADAKERLLALKPVRHSWKDAPETTVDGFIAHEVQEAGFEYAVTGEKNAADMQSMDYGRITPVIVAALQDALKEIDMLKDRILELEAK